jgi:hypothetical protein
MKREQETTLDSRLVWCGVVALVGVLAWLGWGFLKWGGQTWEAYLIKIGELLLQLGILVIVGALVKAAVDWGTSLRARATKRDEERLDLLRRLRAVHVAVSNARDLLMAHQSARTWSEQMRRLMALVPEVHELKEDVAAGHPFRQQRQIEEGLDGIVSYLTEGRDEYRANHQRIDLDYKREKEGFSLSRSLESSQMRWALDLMDAGPRYDAGYAQNLRKSQASIRSETLRGADFELRPELHPPINGPGAKTSPDGGMATSQVPPQGTSNRS